MVDARVEPAYQLHQRTPLCVPSTENLIHCRKKQIFSASGINRPASSGECVHISPVLRRCVNGAHLRACIVQGDQKTRLAIAEADRPRRCIAPSLQRKLEPLTLVQHHNRVAGDDIGPIAVIHENGVYLLLQKFLRVQTDPAQLGTVLIHVPQVVAGIFR